MVWKGVFVKSLISSTACRNAWTLQYHIHGGVRKRICTSRGFRSLRRVVLWCRRVFRFPLQLFCTTSLLSLFSLFLKSTFLRLWRFRVSLALSFTTPFIRLSALLSASYGRRHLALCISFRCPLRLVYDNHYIVVVVLLNRLLPQCVVGDARDVVTVHAENF